jgi:hypothetical protein
MEVVVREGGRYLLTKLIRKGNNYQGKKKNTSNTSIRASPPVTSMLGLH